MAMKAESENELHRLDADCEASCDRVLAVNQNQSQDCSTKITLVKNTFKKLKFHVVASLKKELAEAQHELIVSPEELDPRAKEIVQNWFLANLSQAKPSSAVLTRLAHLAGISELTVQSWIGPTFDETQFSTLSHSFRMRRTTDEAFCIEVESHIRKFSAFRNTRHHP